MSWVNYYMIIVAEYILRYKGTKEYTELKYESFNYEMNFLQELFPVLQFLV